MTRFLTLWFWLRPRPPLPFSSCSSQTLVTRLQGEVAVRDKNILRLKKAAAQHEFQAQHLVKTIKQHEETIRALRSGDGSVSGSDSDDSMMATRHHKTKLTATALWEMFNTAQQKLTTAEDQREVS